MREAQHPTKWCSQIGVRDQAQPKIKDGRVPASKETSGISNLHNHEEGGGKEGDVTEGAKGVKKRMALWLLQKNRTTGGIGGGNGD